MAPSDSPVVRRAKPGDMDAIHEMVDALADYEKLARPAPEARQRLHKDLFGSKPRIECLIALIDNKPVGYAITLEMYSSFLALPTLFLEDLFVLPEARGRRAGYLLFQAALDSAKQRGCGRMEWTVLDWNRLAIDFYDRMGAECMKEWRLYRMSLV
jgi:GNAT superfamily N-acetyltransferase